MSKIIAHVSLRDVSYFTSGTFRGSSSGGPRIIWGSVFFLTGLLKGFNDVALIADPRDLLHLSLPTAPPFYNRDTKQ